MELCGIPLANPLMPAAGTLSREVVGDVAAAYGAIVAEDVTLEPRAGNPPPDSGGFVRHDQHYRSPESRYKLLPQRPGFFRRRPAIIVSVAADTAEDFARMCRQLSTIAG